MINTPLLQEQRLYEMAKLKQQFREILIDSKLLESEQLEEINSGVIIFNL
jgi:hypothetical protein